MEHEGHLLRAYFAVAVRVVVGIHAVAPPCVLLVVVGSEIVPELVNVREVGQAVGVDHRVAVLSKAGRGAAHGKPVRTRGIEGKKSEDLGPEDTRLVPGHAMSKQQKVGPAEPGSADGKNRNLPDTACVEVVADQLHEVSAVFVSQLVHALVLLEGAHVVDDAVAFVERCLFPRAEQGVETRERGMAESPSRDC